MKYPIFRSLGSAGSPTPSDQLLVCDHCQVAIWTIRLHGHVTYHTCIDIITFKYKGKIATQPRGRRMREAAKHEYAEANAALIQGYKKK